MLERRHFIGQCAAGGAAVLGGPGLLAGARETNRRWVEEKYLDRVCYPRLLELYRQLHAGGAGS